MSLDHILKAIGSRIRIRALSYGMVLALGGAYLGCGDEERRSLDPYSAEEYESTDAYCSDGIDNNGNGFIDCGDFGCQFNPYVTVCGRVENTDGLCTDGRDNNGNSFTDCRDYGCLFNLFVSRCGERERTEETCLDGKDNDGNGRTDCQEDSCQYSPFVRGCK